MMICEFGNPFSSQATFPRHSVGAGAPREFQPDFIGKSYLLRRPRATKAATRARAGRQLGNPQSSSIDLRSTSFRTAPAVQSLAQHVQDRSHLRAGRPGRCVRRRPRPRGEVLQQARSPVPFPLRSRMQLLDGGVHRLTGRRLQGGS